MGKFFRLCGSIRWAATEHLVPLLPEQCHCGTVFPLVPPVSQSFDEQADGGEHSDKEQGHGRILLQVVVVNGGLGSFGPSCRPPRVVVFVVKEDNMDANTSHHQTSIHPRPATGLGAIPGFDILCEMCGAVGSSSLRTLALEDAAKHTVYMDRKR